MVVNLFNPGLEKTPPALPESVLKANKLFIENVEKMLLFQMNSLKTCFDISINQLRAAAEITDLDSLRDFYQRQMDIAQTLQCKLLNDARIMHNMAIRFKIEIDALVQTLLQDALPKAA